MPRKLIPWIVLTGGPGGGKSTFLAAARDLLPYRVQTVPETARRLKDSASMRSRSADVDFQREVIQQQLETEAALSAELCRSGGDVRAALLDRGIFDGAAFVGLREYDALLEELSLTRDQVLSRYDGFLVFETCIPTLGARAAGREAPDTAGLRAHAAEVQACIDGMLRGQQKFARVPAQRSADAKCSVAADRLNQLLDSLRA